MIRTQEQLDAALADRADSIARFDANPRGWLSDPRTWPMPEMDTRTDDEIAAESEARRVGIEAAKRDAGQFWSRATVEPLSDGRSRLWKNNSSKVGG